MKILTKTIVFIIGLLTISFSNAQEGEISGKVTDNSGIALAGASVLVDGTEKGATTDFDGLFTIEGIENGTFQITVSYIGFGEKKFQVTVPQTQPLTVSLSEDATQLDETIVTGVFDKRTRMESSVAISTIGVKQIERTAATSASDLLKNVPGVYVNQARGEVANIVYSRGISAGANDDANGYYYVSLQEDGLPVTNLNIGTDLFLRADAGTEKVEAIKGGTASILGANAPGGIFNYISKEGGTSFEGEVRAKYGLEGNLKNPYYRADLNLGGSLSKSGAWTYNVSGFYRESDGARYPGYPMNNGGQFKVNVVNNYKRGKFKVYAKLLDDKNALGEFTPSIGWSDPTIPAGFSATDSYYLPSMNMQLPINDNSARTFRSKDKIYSQQKAVGLNWFHDLGNGFTIKNDGRFQKMKVSQNIPAVVTPFATDGLIFYAIPHLLGKFGEYTFTDRVNGQTLGTVTQVPNIIDGNFAGFNFIPGPNNNFPGANVQPNSLFFLPLFYNQNNRTEFMDQLSFSKKIEKMNFVLGAFYANSKLDILAYGQDLGIALGTMQDQPHLVDITLAGFDGNNYQVTDPNGVLDVGRGGANISELRQIQAALFFGHEWKITDKLNFDWGMRYESLNVSGFNSQAVINEESAGPDGNPLTLYDNFGGTEGPHMNIDNTVGTFSFSGGLNYRINDQNAFYLRYSNGKKSPDINFYLNQTSQFLIDNTPAIAQKVEQFEAGYKMITPNTKLFITPFYSVLSNVPLVQTFNDTDGTNYNAPTQFEKFKTVGVELEANVIIGNGFSIGAGATVQNSKATDYTSWIANDNGPADDTLLDLSGNETEYVPNLMFNINPSYSVNKFFVSLNFSYLGERQANTPNAFQLPAFGTTDLVLGYDFSKKFGLQVNLNNLFNTYGVMGWTGPGGFPAALDRQGITKEYVEANPNAPYSTQGSMPRSFFITASYKF